MKKLLGIILYPAVMVSSIGALLLAIIMIFKKEMSKTFSILYAILEGVAIGGVSFIFNAVYEGIVVQAVFFTSADLLIMLLLYRFRIIKVNDKFRSVIFGATLCIAIVYFINFILGFFKMSVPFLNDSSPIGIVISVVIVAIASFNLLLDFDFIEQGANMNMPFIVFGWCYSAFYIGIFWYVIWLKRSVKHEKGKCNVSDRYGRVGRCACRAYKRFCTIINSIVQKHLFKQQFGKIQHEYKV